MQPSSLFRKISYPCGACSSGRWWVAKVCTPSGSLPSVTRGIRSSIQRLTWARPMRSCLANGPGTFAGRKIGILVTDGVDAAKLDEVKSAAEQAQVNVELIAPAVSGID